MPGPREHKVLSIFIPDGYGYVRYLGAKQNHSATFFIKMTNVPYFKYPTAIYHLLNMEKPIMTQNMEVEIQS